jgi:glycerophosphoryl diester phosphodiesterase
MTAPFQLQGHRGARGLKPENTLPAFETALDLGVTSLETDVHLTRDGVPVLLHDPRVTDQIFRRVDGSQPPFPCHRPLVSTLNFAHLRTFRADGNPDPKRFPAQDAGVTPAARLFGERFGVDPYSPPNLADLFAFVELYAGDGGEKAGKSDEQRRRARAVRFDLELKRVPFHAEAIGDVFTGQGAGTLERRVAEVVRAAGAAARTTVRSFDHRSVRALGELEPGWATAVLVGEMAPVDPAELARRAGARLYCPAYEFLDAQQVRQLRDAGVAVLPWTVNDPDAWQRLLEWGVDGITTDHPDRLAALLRRRGIPF